MLIVIGGGVVLIPGFPLIRDLAAGQWRIITYRPDFLILLINKKSLMQEW
jgi:hypothetical protein